MLSTNNPIYNIYNCTDEIRYSINDIVYDKYFRKVEINDFTYFKSGNCANIYRKDDILFKKYNCDCKYKDYMTRNVFNAIKKNNIPNMVELYDYYYKKNNLLFHILSLDYYTMKCVTDTKITFIDSSKEYLKDVLTKLEDTVERLSELKICIGDASSDNILFTENGVTLLDPDFYRITRYLSKKEVYNYNVYQVILYISRTIYKELYNKITITDHTYFDYDSNDGLVNSFMKSFKNETVRKSLKKEI